MSLPPKFRVFGLTGGIASGKSTVAKMFTALGVGIVDADQVARDVRAPGGEAHAEIVRKFGTADTKALRDLIFNDAAKRKELEALLHPLIRAESFRRLQALKGQTPYALYEATLLVETGRHRDFDGLIVVAAPEEAQMARLLLRDQIEEMQARQAIAAQTGHPERAALASHVLVNDGDLAHLQKQVETLHHSLLQGSLAH